MRVGRWVVWVLLCYGDDLEPGFQYAKIFLRLEME